VTPPEGQTGTDAAETRLVRLLNEGNREAFGVLFGRYQAALYRFALRMSGSPAVADDVVQDVFLDLIRGKHGYRPEMGPLRPFLYGMARNLVRRSMKEVPEEPGEDGRAGDGADPLAGLNRAELTGRVREGVLSLPVHYREAIVLCDLEEMSYEQASQALGCAVGTVRSRLSRGREMLLGKLREVRCMI